jgi:hypothetical protein
MPLTPEETAKALDDLAAAYEDEEDLVELARCVQINLNNIKTIAILHPLIGVAWGQAMGLCLAAIRKGSG